MAGRLIEARHGFETARTLYDPQRDTSLRAKTGTEPLVAIKCYLSFAELALGFPDRAYALVEEAWDSIQGSGQVNATAYAMWHRVILAACAGEATRSDDAQPDGRCHVRSSLATPILESAMP